MISTYNFTESTYLARVRVEGKHNDIFRHLKTYNIDLSWTFSEDFP